MNPALRREFLEELQKVRQISICERQRLPRIFVNSGTLKRIGDLKDDEVNQFSNTDLETKAGYGDYHTSTCDLTVAVG